MADRERKVQPEQTSRVDPDRPSESRAGLGSRLWPAGIRSASPLRFRTCGTTVAHRSLCLKVYKYGHKVKIIFKMERQTFSLESLQIICVILILCGLQIRYKCINELIRTRSILLQFSRNMCDIAINLSSIIHLRDTTAMTFSPSGRRGRHWKKAGSSSGPQECWWCGRCLAQCLACGWGRTVAPSRSHRQSAAASRSCPPQSHTGLQVRGFSKQNTKVSG